MTNEEREAVRLKSVPFINAQLDVTAGVVHVEGRHPLALESVQVALPIVIIAQVAQTLINNNIAFANGAIQYADS